MNEYQQYYEEFGTGYWADEDPKLCRCHGNGWALSDLDTWHTCPVHYNGQQHPEDDSPDYCPPPKVVVKPIPIPVYSEDEIPF